MSDTTTPRRPSPLAAVAGVVDNLGVRATFRQLAAAAAITWGTRSAVQQAGEAQERCVAASRRLAELSAQIRAAELRLDGLREQINMALKKTVQPVETPSEDDSAMIPPGEV